MQMINKVLENAIDSRRMLDRIVTHVPQRIAGTGRPVDLEVENWNAEVERKKAEKAERKRQRDREQRIDAALGQAFGIRA